MPASAGSQEQPDGGSPAARATFDELRSAIGDRRSTRMAPCAWAAVSGSATGPTSRSRRPRCGSCPVIERAGVTPNRQARHGDLTAHGTTGSVTSSANPHEQAQRPSTVVCVERLCRHRTWFVVGGCWFLVLAFVFWIRADFARWPAFILGAVAVLFAVATGFTTEQSCQAEPQLIANRPGRTNGCSCGTALARTPAYR